jgi:hypothetical protein
MVVRTMLAALGFVGTMAVASPAPTMAQGVYLQGPPTSGEGLVGAAPSPSSVMMGASAGSDVATEFLAADSWRPIFARTRSSSRAASPKLPSFFSGLAG